MPLISVDASVKINVIVEGVEGEIKENVLAYLSIVRQMDKGVVNVIMPILNVIGQLLFPVEAARIGCTFFKISSAAVQSVSGKNIANLN